MKKLFEFTTVLDGLLPTRIRLKKSASPNRTPLAVLRSVPTFSVSTRVVYGPNVTNLICTHSVSSEESSFLGKK